MTLMATLRDPETQALVCVMFADGQTTDELGYAGWEIAGTHEGPPPEDGVFADGAWSVPLEVLKERKRTAINALKDQKQGGPAMTPAGLVDNDDEKSKGRLNGAATMALLAKLAAQPFQVNWTMHDNSIVTLDADQMIAMGQAAGLFVAQVQDHATDLKTQIEAATSAAELDAVDINAGWPV